jgi:ribosomal protein L13
VLLESHETLRTETLISSTSTIRSVPPLQEHVGKLGEATTAMSHTHPKIIIFRPTRLPVTSYSIERVLPHHDRWMRQGTFNEEVTDHVLMSVDAIHPAFVSKESVAQMLPWKQPDSRAYNVDVRMFIEEPHLASKTLPVCDVVRIHPCYQ